MHMIVALDAKVDENGNSHQGNKVFGAGPGHFGIDRGCGHANHHANDTKGHERSNGGDAVVERAVFNITDDGDGLV